MSEKLTVTCELEDGRVISGTYHYLAAMERYKAAQTFSNCKRVTLTDPKEASGGR